MFNTLSDKDWKIGDQYRLVKVVGQGSYGMVAKAKCLKTNQYVAIKKIENLFDDLIDAKRVLREIALLKRMKHPNIVNLIEIIKPKDKNNFNEIYLVLEYAPGDLKKLFKSEYNLNTKHILKIAYNIILGLNYIHSAGIWHRDLKPANVLIFDDGQAKICDFGLARSVEQQQKPQQTQQENKSNVLKKLSALPKSDKFKQKLKVNKNYKNMLTSHVVTRWYRAPELILIEKNYDQQIDVWSLGCIFGELLQMLPEVTEDPYNRHPLFPGTSCFPLSPVSNAKILKSGFPVSKMDQLIVITSVLGQPSPQDIEFISDRKALQYIKCLPKKKGMDFAKTFESVPVQIIEFLKNCLQFNPKYRITIKEALQMKIFDSVRKVDLEKVQNEQPQFDFEDIEFRNHQELRQYFLKEIFDQITKFRNLTFKKYILFFIIKKKNKKETKILKIYRKGIFQAKLVILQSYLHNITYINYNMLHQKQFFF